MKKILPWAALFAAFLFQPQTVLAATPTNVYCSNNSGVTWVACTSPSSSSPQPVVGLSQAPTYYATGTGYTAYATPQDMVCLTGSATKTVILTFSYLAMQSTAGALQTIYFVKRSTANSGGTSTNPAPTSYDSTNAAATAVVTLYTAIPTPGTLSGNMRIEQTASTAVTAAGAILSSGTLVGSQVSTVSLQQPWTLHGTGEEFCMNYNGAALTTGFTAFWGIEWVEK